jgi:site-specific DNA-cytosine methylase
MRTLKDNCSKLGYSLAYKKAQFARFDDPENRTRCVCVGFHESVKLAEEWKFLAIAEQ